MLFFVLSREKTEQNPVQNPEWAKSRIEKNPKRRNSQIGHNPE